MAGEPEPTSVDVGAVCPWLYIALRPTAYGGIKKPPTVARGSSREYWLAPWRIEISFPW